MQISDIEVKKIIHSKQLVAEIFEIGELRSRAEDDEIVREVTQSVLAMGDRESRIAEIRAKIQAGTYHVDADAIADAMIRRNIADKLV
jgi:anti-sigma28 factor (negative regulator of flagellin synthesis)